jgi:riboflavin transporter FmnP
LAEYHLSRNEIVVGGAVFGALSVVLTLLPTSLPFAPVPYLRFEVAEIPVVLAALLFGPRSGLLASFEYWLVLQAMGVDAAFFGPELKFLATSSTVVGIWAAGKAYDRLNFGPSLGRFLLMVIPLASVVRVAVMTAANWALLEFVFPGLVDAVAVTLGGFIGMPLSGQGEGLFFILLFTALFNVAHIFVSVLPSAFVSTTAITRSSKFGAKYWIRAYARADAKRVGSTSI